MHHLPLSCAPWLTAWWLPCLVFLQLYVVSKEQERVSWRFVAFRILADVLQLFLLIVSPSYGWNIDADNP
jgi:hypothetical protein